MIELVCFVRRHPALDRDAFHARWREHHGPLVAANPAVRQHVVRYEQHHRKARDYERTDTPYDGAAILRFPDLDAFIAMVQDPRYAEVAADEQELVDHDDLVVLFTEPALVVVDGPEQPEGGCTTLVCGVRAKPGMACEDFHRYWAEVHGPLNRDTPAVAKYMLRYEQRHRLAQDYETGATDLDGVTVEWFASARDFFGMAMDPECQRVLVADEARFLDRERLLWILADGPEVMLDQTPGR